MPRSLVLATLALAGVIVSVAMVLLGLPEANPVQSVLLELSALPLSVAVGIGVWMLHERADGPIPRRSRVVLMVSSGLVALGLLLIGWAYVIGPRDVVHAGQGLVWLGLFAALVVMVQRQPRNRTTRFELTDDADADAEDEDDAHADAEDENDADAAPAPDAEDENENEDEKPTDEVDTPTPGASL